MANQNYVYPLHAKVVHLGIAAFGIAAYLTACNTFPNDRPSCPLPLVFLLQVPPAHIADPTLDSPGQHSAGKVNHRRRNDPNEPLKEFSAT